jgi:hypothetical protein
MTGGGETSEARNGAIIMRASACAARRAARWRLAWQRRGIGGGVSPVPAIRGDQGFNGAHWAYRVMSPVTGVQEKKIEPPSFSVFQHTNR